MEHVFRPHPIPRSHDNKFSVRWDHHPIDDARGQVDFANHRRLPDVRLVQFRPGAKFRCDNSSAVTQNRPFMVTSKPAIK